MTETGMLSDRDIAEIEEMFPHAEYQPSLSPDEVPPCEFCKGTIDDHKANCVVPHVHALCQTVRALRATHSCGTVDSGSVVGGCGKEVLTTDGFRCADCLAWFHRDCINEHFKLDAYVKKLRELREQGAIDDWKKSLADKEAENTALRDQLAQRDGEVIILREQLVRVCELAETRSDIIAAKAAHVDQLQSQLAQVEKERDRWKRRAVKWGQERDTILRDMSKAAAKS